MLCDLITFWFLFVFLQFEGGLYTTALVVDGAYKLAAKEKKAPTMSDVCLISQ